eukprot:10386-Heterococcus_DN1.PRE.2
MLANAAQTYSEEDVLEDDTSSATAAAVVAAGMKGAFGINSSSSSSANASMMMLQGDGTDDGASSLPHLLAKYAQVYNKNGRIGIYTRQEREAIIARFKAKRQRRVWRKKIRYNCRKNLADKRLRIKGRFVKMSAAQRAALQLSGGTGTAADADAEMDDGSSDAPQQHQQQQQQQRRRGRSSSVTSENSPDEEYSASAWHIAASEFGVHHTYKVVNCLTRTDVQVCTFCPLMHPQHQQDEEEEEEEVEVEVYKRVRRHSIAY